MSAVFISYARENTAFARRLVESLESAGRDSWIDWGDLSKGSQWWPGIQQGIDTAENFVFLVTPDSLASPVCHLEIAHARARNKRIVPVMHLESRIETALGEIAAIRPDATLNAMLAGRDILLIARDNWRILSEINWIFFRESDDFQDAFDSLVRTLETDQEHVKLHTRIGQRAAEWQTNERKPAYALRADDLRQAEIWLAAAEGKDPQPAALHREYIAASRKVQGEEDSRRRNLTQARFGLVLAVALLALIGIVFLNLQNTQQTAASASLAAQIEAANNNLATADMRATEVAAVLGQAQSLAWAANAQQLAQAGDPFTALALALEANRLPDPPFLAQSALAQLAYAGARRHFAGHSGSVWSVVFSPDGKSILSGGEGGELILWDGATGGEIRRFAGHSGVVYSAVFSPDGKSILSGGEGGELILWDGATGGEIRRFAGHDPNGFVLSAVFSPDGQRILSGGSDPFGGNPELILWDGATGGEIRRFAGHSGVVLSAVFSPDGQRILSGGSGGELILWDGATGGEIRRFAGHSGVVYSAVFSPDGQRILSGGAEGELILWDGATGAKSAVSPDTAELCIARSSARMGTALCRLVRGAN